MRRPTKQKRGPHFRPCLVAIMKSEDEIGPPFSFKNSVRTRLAFHSQPFRDKAAKMRRARELGH